jgi:hypothetical protein
MERLSSTPHPIVAKRLTTLNDRHSVLPRTRKIATTDARKRQLGFNAQP